MQQSQGESQPVDVDADIAVLEPFSLLAAVVRYHPFLCFVWFNLVLLHITTPLTLHVMSDVSFKPRLGFYYRRTAAMSTESKALCVQLPRPETARLDDQLARLPTTYQYIKAILTIGALELVRQDFDGAMPVRTSVSANLELLARLFGCSKRRIRRYLAAASFRYNRDPFMCVGRSSGYYKTKENVHVAFMDFVAIGMMGQERYAGAKLCQQITTADLRLVASTCGVILNQCTMQGIWALFETVLDTHEEGHRLVMILREQFIRFYPELAVVLRNFS